MLTKDQKSRLDISKYSITSVARTRMARLPLTPPTFYMDDSNLFFRPYKILPIAQVLLNIFRDCFSYFIMELYVVCTHKNRLIKAILMSALDIQSV